MDYDVRPPATTRPGPSGRSMSFSSERSAFHRGMDPTPFDQSGFFSARRAGIRSRPKNKSGKPTIKPSRLLGWGKCTVSLPASFLGRTIAGVFSAKSHPDSLAGMWKQRHYKYAGEQSAPGEATYPTWRRFLGACTRVLRQPRKLWRLLFPLSSTMRFAAAS